MESNGIVAIVNAAGFELRKFPREAIKASGIHLHDISMDDSEKWVGSNDAVEFLAAAAAHTQAELQRAMWLVLEASKPGSAGTKGEPVHPSKPVEDEPDFESAGPSAEPRLPKAGVLVNCAMGRSRSSSVVLWWILTYAQPEWTLLDALCFLRSRRTWAYPRLCFLRILYRLSLVPGSHRASVARGKDLDLDEHELTEHAEHTEHRTIDGTAASGGAAAAAPVATAESPTIASSKVEARAEAALKTAAASAGPSIGSALGVASVAGGESSGGGVGRDSTGECEHDSEAVARAFARFCASMVNPREDEHAGKSLPQGVEDLEWLHSAGKHYLHKAGAAVATLMAIQPLLCIKDAKALLTKHRGNAELAANEALMMG